MIKWSFSSLKQFINCPRQYNEVKVKQNYSTKITQQILYGQEVHKALEDYARDGTELPKFYQKYRPMIDALLDISGKKFFEHKMALDAEKQPCEFDDKDYWVRGIVDFMVIADDGTAFIVDYKTGSNKYPDPKQLQLMALLAFVHFPEIRRVKAGLLFVAHNTFLPYDYEREDNELLWSAFDRDLLRLEAAAEADKWPANPTPLCRWCPVTTCEFHKE
jgi:RecB family exonuclease